MGEKWLQDADGFDAAATAAGMKESVIAVAYLDNYDWTYPWTKTMAYKVQQHLDYQEQGLSLSNAQSQETHLRQVLCTLYVGSLVDGLHECALRACSSARMQLTDVRQAVEVVKRCSERCFVLFDDTWAGAAAGLYNGKGAPWT